MKLSFIIVALAISSSQAKKHWFRGWRGGNGDGLRGGCEDGQTQLKASPASLDDGEKQDMLFMREEEKMARDVYWALHEKWGEATFAMIAKAEQNHMNRMGEMLSLYGIEDPVGDRDPGDFSNTGIKGTYDTLVADGTSSLENAILVGAWIEERDISDLDEAIDGTSESRLIRVYESFKRASGNHLRRFVSLYEASYGPYEPRILSDLEYEEIVN